MGDDGFHARSNQIVQPHWWQPSQIPVTSSKLLYRSRFESLWADLPQLLVLAALPGWGKRTWKEQSADYLSRTRPDLKLHWARGIQDLGSILDGVRGGAGDVICFLDGRDAGADDSFWGELAVVLAARPWVRCIVGTYGYPPLDRGSLAELSEPEESEAKSILADALVMNEGELSFNAEELSALRQLLGDDGMLNDLLLDGKREKGCPYLVGQHIERMTAPGHVGTWVATDPRIELRLLSLLDGAVKQTRLSKYPIGKALREARRFRAVSADLLAGDDMSHELATSMVARFSSIPLFDRDSDDELQVEQWGWRGDVWRAIAEGEPSASKAARLGSGLADVRRSGRIAAQLIYLLETGSVVQAEELVRRNFRWFLMFCDQWATRCLEEASVDPARAPALTLLQTELRLRSHGFDPELRAEADAAFQRLRGWQATSTYEEIERGGLLSYGATLAGHRGEASRYVRHVIELVDTAKSARKPIDDAARIRSVGACYLAYWSALQADLHDEALELAEAIVRYSDPKDRLYFYEHVSLVTEQDLHGLRSMSPTGERPSTDSHSQAQPLVDLEEGADGEAFGFLRPIIAHDSGVSRSALDALILVGWAVASPDELSASEIEMKLSRSSRSWDDGRPSSFLVWAAVIAFASIGAGDKARAWVDSLSTYDDVFAKLARMTLAQWEGDADAAYATFESIDWPIPPRLAVYAWTITAASQALRGDQERAALSLKTVWRQYPAPRLFRFALRFVPQAAFDALRALSDQIPQMLSQVFEDSIEDKRAIRWVEDPRLTPSEREILEMLSLGRTNRQIAEARFVTVGTVRSQLKTLYRKLGASDRLDALEIVERFRLLDRGGK